MSCRFPGTLVESVKPNSFGGKGLLSDFPSPSSLDRTTQGAVRRGGCGLAAACSVKAGPCGPLWFPFRLAELVFPPWLPAVARS